MQSEYLNFYESLSVRHLTFLSISRPGFFVVLFIFMNAKIEE